MDLLQKLIDYFSNLEKPGQYLKSLIAISQIKIDTAGIDYNLPVRELITAFYAKLLQSNDNYGQFLKVFESQSQCPHNPEIVVKDNLQGSGINEKAFVGREDDLSKLHEKLQNDSRVAISTLTGMGGIGKTELALQYALKDRDKKGAKKFYQGAICWVNVAEVTADQVIADLLNFSQYELGIIPPEEFTTQEKIAHCWRRWPQQNNLIIFDDVREYEQIYSALPPQKNNFKVIITSRKNDLSAQIENLIVEVLELEAAVDLMRFYLTEERVNSQLTEVEGLCNDLGCLPLGIELVARFLKRKQKWTVETMRQRLKTEGLKHESLGTTKSEILKRTAQSGVVAALDISWQELRVEDREMCCYLGLFALAPIPYNLIKENWAKDEDLLQEILDEQLVNLNLIKELENNVYAIHTLVRQYFRDKLEELASHELQEKFCQLMVAEAKKIPQDPTTLDIKTMEPSIPHIAESTTEYLINYLPQEEIVWPFVGLGWFYQGQTLYELAETQFQQCLDLCQNLYPDDHPDVATSLNNLGGLY